MKSKIEPAPLTSGVIQSQPLSLDPGLVRADEAGPGQDGAGQGRHGQGSLPPAPTQVAPQITNTISPRTDVAGDLRRRRRPGPTSSTSRSPQGPKAAEPRPAPKRPQQPAGLRHRQRHPRRAAGGRCPGAAPRSPSSPPPLRHRSRFQQSATTKPVAIHTGWIVQVGALESESEAQQRLEAARSSARGLLSKADPFTEPVVAKDNRKLYRARFAGLERDQAEAVCRALHRSDISCMTVRN